MHVRTRLALAGLTAALLLAFTVNTTNANRLSLTNQNFRIVWTLLQFFDNNGEPKTECPVTMEGSFHSRTIVKRADSLIGYITRAIVTEAMCNNGPSKFQPASLPWHVTYQSFSGLLPRITKVRVLVRGISFENVITGVGCVFGETGAQWLGGEFSVEAGGAITTFEFDPTTRLPRTGGGLCFQTESGLRNAGTVTLLGNTTRIVLTLI